MDLRNLFSMAFRAFTRSGLCDRMGGGRIASASVLRHGQPDDRAAGDAGVGRLAHVRKAQGTEPMKVSQEGVDLIKHFEGCYLNAYLCPAGVWTVGYGHTKGVKEGDAIEQEAAEAFLIEDLESFEQAVTRLVEVPLTQQQFDALVSWTFNLGAGNLAESTLLRKLNNYQYAEVPEQMMRWVKAGGQVLDGLVRRRAAEAALFQNKDWREA